MFGGVGLFALPIDIFLEYKHRPKPIKKSEYLEKKLTIGEVASTLMNNSSILQKESKSLGAKKNSRFNRKGRNYRSKENEFIRVSFAEFKLSWTYVQ